jgi:hypothetical protein
MIGCGPGGSCCGTCRAVTRPVTMDGFFSTILNVAGSFVGDPALGNQVASQGSPGYAPITQDAQAIAKTVAPSALTALKGPVDLKTVSPQAQQIAASVSGAVAVELASQGYVFPPGSYGAELQKPSIFDAFGGQNKTYAELGFAALGALLLFKVLKG